MDKLDVPAGAWHQRDTEEYLSWFYANLTDAKSAALAAGTATLLDTTPSYMSAYATPARARAVMPHARIVAVIRVRRPLPPVPTDRTDNSHVQLRCVPAAFVHACTHA